MPRSRATMEESTGGTHTTTIAARTSIADASAEPEFTPDYDVDLEDENIDLGPDPPAVAGGGSKPRRSKQKACRSDAVLDHDMEENATAVGDKLARRRRHRGGGKHKQRHTWCPQNRHFFFFEQTDAVLQFLQWDES